MNGVWSKKIRNELYIKSVGKSEGNKTDRRTYKFNNEARSRNCCCSGEAVNVTYSECVPLACNANAPYCHLWPVRLYNFFSTLSDKRQDFRKKKSLDTKCVF
jgi:hypothetical protein